MKLLTPGLVFADDADKFAEVLAANVSAETEIVASYGAVPGRDVTTLPTRWPRQFIRASIPCMTRSGRIRSQNSADVGLDRQSC